MTRPKADSFQYLQGIPSILIKNISLLVIILLPVGCRYVYSVMCNGLMDATILKIGVLVYICFFLIGGIEDTEFACTIPSILSVIIATH